MLEIFSVEKAERTKLRSLPLLPRVAVTVEMAGRHFTFRHVPILETVVNLRGRGFSLANFFEVTREELSEIRLPAVKKAALASVKQLHSRVAKAKSAATVRKAAPKAAAKRKSDDAQ